VTILKTILAFSVLPWVICAEALAIDPAHPTGGVGVGVAYTPDARFSGVSWTLNETFEHVVGRSLEVRGMVGVAKLTSDTSRSGHYSFIVADVLSADLVTPVGGVGIYHPSFRKFSSSSSNDLIVMGVHGGIRLLIPYHHDHGVSLETEVHRVFGNGPAVLVTLTAGFVF